MECGIFQQKCFVIIAIPKASVSFNCCLLLYCWTCSFRWPLLAQCFRLTVYLGRGKCLAKFYGNRHVYVEPLNDSVGNVSSDSLQNLQHYIAAQFMNEFQRVKLFGLLSLIEMYRNDLNDLSGKWSKVTLLKS